MPTSQAQVSIVTPAYNAGKFLQQCIESALAQRHTAFEHVIVDNASTDDTRAIAESYARRDSRVRVISHPHTLPFVDNWNSVLEAISASSLYCQTLHADDWLYPNCLERMVALGERNPSAGVFGSLRLRGEDVQCGGLPRDRELFSGSEIARMFLRGEAFAMAPTSGMIRADLVRARRPFYPARYLHADLAAYFAILADTDYGFCHEVLAFSRPHDGSITRTVAERRKTLIREWPMMMAEYGLKYFSRDEYDLLIRRHYRRHHRVLVRAMATGAGKDFLRYHLEGMRLSGHRPTMVDFGRAIADEVTAGMADPGKVFRHIQKLLARG